VAASFGQRACYKAAVIGHTIQGTPCNYVLRFIPMLTVPPRETHAHLFNLTLLGEGGGGSSHSDEAPSDVIQDAVTRRTYPHVLAL